MLYAMSLPCFWDYNQLAMHSLYTESELLIEGKLNQSFKETSPLLPLNSRNTPFLQT